MPKASAWSEGIHERKVKLPRAAITTKLKVQSVAELTRLTQEAGIVPNPGANLPQRAVDGVTFPLHSTHGYR
jgi:hypothetical protein